MTSPKTRRSKFKLQYYQHQDHFGDWLGYKIKRIDRKHHAAVCTLILREDHLSPAGRIHGGVISAFLDFACGSAVFSTLGPKDLCSTVELKVNYLRPLFVGDRLEAKTRATFRGKRLCVVQGDLYRGKESAPVAIATATFNVISDPGEAPKARRKAP
jgi:uncharacterized protein (TIGR00369 family)